VLVVGAGIVGAAVADACAAGGLRVLVVDRGAIGAGTTAAGMGHLVVMDDSEAQFALTSTSCRLWRELLSELPDDVEYDPCGTLWAAADDEEMEEVHRKSAYYTARGVATEILDGPQVAAAEPELRPGLAGGLRVPGDAVLYPPCATRFLLERAVARGAAVRPGVSIHAIQPNGRAILDNGSTLDAAVIVLAAGALAARLRPELPIVRRKGHLVITDRYPGFAHHQIVELGYLKSAHALTADSVAFNIQPRKNGQMLIGSSRQYEAPSADVEPAMLAQMLARASLYMPRIGRLSAIRAWAGFRPATPDKRPLIGPYAEVPGLWLATGHEGLGITTSIGTGRIVADRLLGRTTEGLDPSPFDPARLESETPPHG
jgi:glycine/D-amino acid oxidase-like deaminating enzyme